MLKHSKIILLLSLGFLFSSCASIIKGTSQTINISSTPDGATVYVDSIEVGITPATIILSKKDDHKVQIELSGYETQNVAINSFVSPEYLLFLAPDLYVGLLVLQSNADPQTGLSKQEIDYLYFLAPFVIDCYYGAWNKLTPENIYVKLKNSETASIDKQDKIIIQNK